MFNNRWKARGWRWRRNPARGESFIFEVWKKREITQRDGTKFTLYEGWERRGMVYRAHRGDRWVYRDDRTKVTRGSPYLREAMRLGLFFTLLEGR